MSLANHVVPGTRTGAETTVVVFAKAPIPGLAKTRLAPALGEAGAAALAERLLHHTVTQALLATGAQVADVELCVAPSLDHPAFARWQGTPRLQLALQREGDLGARMEHALLRGLQRARAVLLIGTDAPALDAPMLRAAARQLVTHDAVMVAAADGGYALLGLKAPMPELFSHMPWSTSDVAALTRAQLQAAGRSLAQLASVHDIDTPEDLCHLPPGWLDTRS